MSQVRSPLPAPTPLRTRLRQKPRFEPAHPRLESLDLGLLLLDRFFLRLHGTVLLLHLVSHQGVDQVVVNRAELAVLIVTDEVRVNLNHFLGNQAVLGEARRIQLGFVLEDDRAQPHQAIALIGDVPNVLLEATRGNREAGAELPAGADEDGRATGEAHTADPGNKGCRLGSPRPDPDRARLARHAGIPDANVVAPRREANACTEADPDVAEASGIKERIVADGGVVVTRDVV